jgi:hypothetical protein
VEALRFGFEIAARGGPVEGATLEIEPLAGGRDVRVKLLEAG